MTVGEIIALFALIISGLSLIRTFGKDSKNSTVELTTVIVKLESLEKMINMYHRNEGSESNPTP